MCEHKNFIADVTVNRLGEPIADYMADVRIKCADCGLPFEFKGVPPVGRLKGVIVPVKIIRHGR